MRQRSSYKSEDETIANGSTGERAEANWTFTPMLPPPSLPMAVAHAFCRS
jgi:hypothetical protein